MTLKALERLKKIAALESLLSLTRGCKPPQDTFQIGVKCQDRDKGLIMSSGVKFVVAIFPFFFLQLSNFGGIQLSEMCSEEKL